MSTRHFLGLAIGLLMAACSSDDGGDSSGQLSCEPFAACGGELTGKWKVNNSCVSDAAKAQVAEAAKVCDQGTASVTDVDVSGSLTFDQQSAIYDAVIEVAIASSFPLSCATGAASCDDVQQRLTTDGRASDVTCSTMGASCACQYRQSIPVKRQSSYVVSGSTITETDPSDGSKETGQYCVSGKTLRIKGAESVDVFTR